MVRKHHLEIGFIISAGITIMLGGGFLFWFYEVDGAYMNRVLTFPASVDPYNLKTSKSQYRRGELIQFENQFCKTREAQASTKWTLANESLIPLRETNWADIPIGCYPANGTILVDVARVPMNALPGIHYVVGVSTHLLPGNREGRNL